MVLVVVGGVAAADAAAVDRTQSAIQSRIEHRFPDSHPHVTVSSPPFLVRLALYGDVDRIHVHVTGVTQGRLSLSAIDVDVHKLRLSRTALLHGSVKVTGMSSATITVTLSFSDLVRDVGPTLSGLLGLGSGAIGSVTVDPSGVTVGFGPLKFTFSYNALVPCIGSAHVRGTDVILTCTTRTIPPALRSA